MGNGWGNTYTDERYQAKLNARVKRAEENVRVAEENVRRVLKADVAAREAARPPPKPTAQPKLSVYNTSMELLCSHGLDGILNGAKAVDAKYPRSEGMDPVLEFLINGVFHDEPHHLDSTRTLLKDYRCKDFIGTMSILPLPDRDRELQVGLNIRYPAVQCLKKWWHVVQTRCKGASKSKLKGSVEWEQLIGLRKCDPAQFFVVLEGQQFVNFIYKEAQGLVAKRVVGVSKQDMKEQEEDLAIKIVDDLRIGRKELAKEFGEDRVDHYVDIITVALKKMSASADRKMEKQAHETAKDKVFKSTAQSMISYVQG